MKRRKVLLIIYLCIIFLIIGNDTAIISASSNPTNPTNSTQIIQGYNVEGGNADVDVNGGMAKTTGADTPTTTPSPTTPSTNNVGDGVNDDLTPPDTGDISNFVPYIMVLIIPVCIILFLMKRRKDEEEDEICEKKEI